MAYQFIAEANQTVDIPNTTGSTITQGTVVQFGTLIGIAVRDIPTGTTGAFYIGGVHRVPKLSTDNVTLGALLYWDSSEAEFTLSADSGTNRLAGKALGNALSGTDEVPMVLINV